MAAENPQVIERRMYVDMLLNGVDDPSLTLAELRDKTGGGANVHRSVTSASADTGGTGGFEQIVSAVPVAGAAQALVIGLNYLTLTSPICTLTLPDAPTIGEEVFVSLQQDAVGGRTVIWPGIIVWPFNVIPSTLSEPFDADEFSLRFDGTQWRGLQIASFA